MVVDSISKMRVLKFYFFHKVALGGTPEEDWRYVEEVKADFAQDR